MWISWQAYVLPYMDQAPLYNSLDLSGATRHHRRGPETGLATRVVTGVGKPLNGITVPYAKCPTDPFPAVMSFPGRAERQRELTAPLRVDRADQSWNLPAVRQPWTAEHRRRHEHAVRRYGQRLGQLRERAGLHGIRQQFSNYGFPGSGMSLTAHPTPLSWPKPVRSVPGSPTSTGETCGPTIGAHR